MREGENINGYNNVYILFLGRDESCDMDGRLPVCSDSDRSHCDSCCG